MAEMFVFRMMKKERRVFPAHIIRLAADGSYTKFYLECGDVITESGNLQKQLFRLRKIKQFIRVHRSHVINTAYIKEIIKDHYVLLTCGTKVPLGSEYQPALLLRHPSI